MRKIKYLLISLVAILIGLSGWCSLATLFHDYADRIAFGVIEDTLVSNAARDLKKYQELLVYLDNNDLDSAKALVKDQIDLKLYTMELCVSEECNEIHEKIRAK